MKRKIPRLGGEAKFVAKGELIGQSVTLAKCSDQQLTGLRGTIVDETLRTLILQIDGEREMQVSKAGNSFCFNTEKGDVEIDGRAIEFRSWDRTKKVR